MSAHRGHLAFGILHTLAQYSLLVWGLQMFLTFPLLFLFLLIYLVFVLFNRKIILHSSQKVLRSWHLPTLQNKQLRYPREELHKPVKFHTIKVTIP